MWKKLISHKNVMYSKFPRIKSFFNKGFFVIDTIGPFHYKIYYNRHIVGYEHESGALNINWNKLKNAGYIERNAQ